jgi:hypothetical protein
MLGLRALADAERSLRARLRSTPLLAACQVIGTLWAGAAGFALGFAVGQSITSVIWWTSFRQALAERERDIGRADHDDNSNGAGSIGNTGMARIVTSTDGVSQEVVIP